MSIIDTIRDWWNHEQTNWTLENVSAPALPPPVNALPEGQVLEMHKAYVTVRMRSMAIASSRSGWNSFHAALHSETSLGLRNGNTAVIQSVLSPDHLRDLDAKRLERVLHIDRAIFGPMPYIGGPLSLNMGVFAIKHTDLAVPFLNVLETLASTAGVAFISAATPFVEPIKKSVELLTGSADATSLEIGILREMDPLVTGWRALVRIPGGSLTPGQLSVAPESFDLLCDGKPMPGIPYLVYSIDAATTRPDWARIPEIKAAYTDFTDAVKRNKQEEAEDSVNAFRRIARICPELLRTHVDDVIKAVSEEYSQVFPDVAAPTITRTLPGHGKDSPRELRGLAVKFRPPM